MSITQKDASPAEPKIIFEDTHLIVVDKPAGFLSQDDGTEAPSLVKWLSQHVGRPYVGVVHRLDRNTSGLMVYAKRTKSASRLSDSLKKGDLERRYQAFLWGQLSEKSFCWKDTLLKDEARNVVSVVRDDNRSSEAKKAVLNGKVLSARGGISLVEFVLETGRSHQIRVQSRHRGHPLVGDQKYDGDFSKRPLHFSRPALHSCYLSFPHPMNASETLTFVSELPQDMAKVWSRS